MAVQRPWIWFVFALAMAITWCNYEAVGFQAAPDQPLVMTTTWRALCWLPYVRTDADGTAFHLAGLSLGIAVTGILLAIACRLDRRLRRVA